MVITFEQFAFEIREFRKLMGSREFWSRPQSVHDAALRGLTHAYMAIDPVDTERAAAAYDAATQEYERRRALI